MSLFRKFLIAVIVIELLAFGYMWHLRSRAMLLPPVDWSACLIDEATASEIRTLENHLRPDNPADWAELGATYRAFGLFPQAEYCYRQVDKLAPTDQGYLYYWAECFSLMGQTQEATKLYRQIINNKKLAASLGANVAFSWLGIGEDFLREENVPAAIEALRHADDIHMAKFLQARVLIRSGRAPEAVNLLNDLLSKDPDVLDYNQMMSWAQAALGNQVAAQDYYERSLRSGRTMNKMYPTYYSEVLKRRNAIGINALMESSLRLQAEGNIQEALKTDSKALKICWTERGANIQAKLELLAGHPKEAINMAENCIGRVGASAQNMETIGLAFHQLGDTDKACRALEQSAELEPDPQLYKTLASWTDDLQLKQRYEAREQYLLGKQAWLTNGLTTAGLTTARDHFEKAVALLDDDPYIWFYLAETRRYLGDAAGAEAAYRRCLQINPDFGRALRGLDRLKSTAGK
jgi:tetratricopeptide (TPR) repeat protein